MMERKQGINWRKWRLIIINEKEWIKEIDIIAIPLPTNYLIEAEVDNY
jgi:hypothetical protein